MARSKRYPPKKLPSARRALGNLSLALSSLHIVIFNLRMAGDERAAVGVERAVERLKSWQGKVAESINLSAAGEAK